LAPKERKSRFVALKATEDDQAIMDEIKEAYKEQLVNLGDTECIRVALRYWAKNHEKKKT
jgi:hypothetical protein